MAENPFAAEIERRKRFAQGLPPLPKRTAPPQANPFAVELERRRLSANAPSFFEAAGRAGLRSFLDNVLNLGEFMASGFGSQQGPLSVLKDVNLPSAADVIAGAETVQDVLRPGQTQFQQLPAGTGLAQAAQLRAEEIANQGVHPAPTIQQRFATRRMLEDLTSQRFAEQRPVATIVGDVGADVATLVAGRTPFARPRVRAGAARELSSLRPGGLRRVDDIMRGFSHRFGRGVAKAGETGLEGAVLAIANEGDPVKTAALAAGGQAAGSLVLYFAEKPIKRAIPFVVGTIILKESFKALGPGSQNFFESKDEAIRSLLFAAGTGVFAALVGAGRIGGRTSEDLPKIADAITAIPRGAALSLLQDLTKADQKGDDTVIRVLDTVVEHPNAFTPAIMDRLSQAFNNGKLAPEIDRLMRDKKFRERVDELSR